MLYRDERHTQRNLTQRIQRALSNTQVDLIRKRAILAHPLSLLLVRHIDEI